MEEVSNLVKPNQVIASFYAYMYRDHKDHRYTPEILEPAPFVSSMGLNLGVIRFFLVIKITVVRQVHMLLHLRSLS